MLIDISQRWCPINLIDGWVSSIVTVNHIKLLNFDCNKCYQKETKVIGLPKCLPNLIQHHKNHRLKNIPIKHPFYKIWVWDQISPLNMVVKFKLDPTPKWTSLEHWSYCLNNLKYLSIGRLLSWERSLYLLPTVWSL
jgi:hypothetical protein